MPENRVRPLEIAAIALDGGTQPRTYTAADRYKTYAEDMERGDLFPPVIVFTDASHTFWLADGFHRVRAILYLHAVLQERSSASVQAEVRTVLEGESGLRAAILYACSANHGHGIPRTQEDKRFAVDRMLKDKTWAGWSNRKIADWCHVSYPTVGARREELNPVPSGKSYQMSRTVERGGTVYRQDITGIAASNRIRGSIRDGAKPQNGAARPGHREPDHRSRAIRIERMLHAAVTSIEALPLPETAAAALCNFDLARLDRAAIRLADIVEELRERAERKA